MMSFALFWGLQPSLPNCRLVRNSRLPVLFFYSPTAFLVKTKMAGGRIAHVTLKGPSVVKELVIGATLGLAAGTLWKMHHWNEQRKVRAFYDMLEKGQISVVAAEE